MMLSNIEWAGLTDVFLDALLDSAIILPVLFLVHVLMAVVDRFAGKKTQKGLKGPFSPLIGAAAGCLPQCGFSVAGARLYTQKYISLGALIAVFISTSDEAVLILLSSSESAKKLLPLLAIKLVYALVAGYTLNLIVYLIARNKKRRLEAAGGSVLITCRAADDLNLFSHKKGRHETPPPVTSHELSAAEKQLSGQSLAQNELSTEQASGQSANRDGLEHSEIADNSHGHTCGCGCGGKNKKTDAWHTYALHPFIHTLKIFAYVLAVNLVLGVIIFFVTPQRFEAFVSNLTVWQPALAALVGLIPNCASAVVLAEMYGGGMLTLGAAVAGLSAAAGLGYAVLIKEHKNKLNVVLIIVGMYVFSTIVGMFVDLIF